MENYVKRLEQNQAKDLQEIAELRMVNSTYRVELHKDRELLNKQSKLIADLTTKSLQGSQNPDAKLMQEGIQEQKKLVQRLEADITTLQEQVEKLYL